MNGCIEKALEDDLAVLSQESGDIYDVGKVGLIDLVAGSRLLLGRAPTEAEFAHFRESPPSGLDELLEIFLASQEFKAKNIALDLDRPAHNCLVMTQTPEGLRFFFSLRDTFVGIPIAVGVFERDVDAVLKKVLKPGMNCLDIGANLGYYSVRMAAVAGQGGGRVFSFEPDPLAFYLLTKNRQENHFEDVITVFPIACGEADSQGVMVANPNPANFGGAHVQEGSGTVPIRRVDDLIPPDIHIHLVKIDIEGAEPLALRGMPRILSRDRPIILMEFYPEALRSFSPNAPKRLLQDMHIWGYRCFEASTYGPDSIPFSPRGEALVNLICIPLGKSL